MGGRRGNADGAAVNDRDRWVTVTVGRQGLVRLSEYPWEVVDADAS